MLRNIIIIAIVNLVVANVVVLDDDIKSRTRSPSSAAIHKASIADAPLNGTRSPDHINDVVGNVVLVDDDIVPRTRSPFSAAIHEASIAVAPPGGTPEPEDTADDQQPLCESIAAMTPPVIATNTSCECAAASSTSHDRHPVGTITIIEEELQVVNPVGVGFVPIARDITINTEGVVPDGALGDALCGIPSNGAMPIAQTTPGQIPSIPMALPIPREYAALPVDPTMPMQIPSMPMMQRIPNQNNAVPTVPMGSPSMQRIPNQNNAVPTVPMGIPSMQRIPNQNNAVPTVPMGIPSMQRIPNQNNAVPTAPMGIPSMPMMQRIPNQIINPDGSVTPIDFTNNDDGDDDFRPHLDDGLHTIAAQGKFVGKDAVPETKPTGYCRARVAVDSNGFSHGIVPFVVGDDGKKRILVDDAGRVKVVVPDTPQIRALIDENALSHAVVIVDDAKHRNRVVIDGNGEQRLLVDGHVPKKIVGDINSKKHIAMDEHHGHVGVPTEAPRRQRRHSVHISESAAIEMAAATTKTHFEKTTMQKSAIKRHRLDVSMDDIAGRRLTCSPGFMISSVDRATASGDNNCHADLLPATTSNCIGKADCNVDVAGVRCSNARIVVDFACSPPESPLQCRQVHQNTTLHCLNGNVFVGFDFGFFGQVNGTCEEGIVPGSCSRNIVTDLESKCIGKTSCFVEADARAFGLPCKGANPTTMSLTAGYRCGSKAQIVNGTNSTAKSKAMPRPFSLGKGRGNGSGSAGPTLVVLLMMTVMTMVFVA